MLDTESLRKNYQFKLVYNRGKSFAGRYAVMFVLKNRLDYNRLGISVSKKIGNSVIRNRTRRRIRESYRTIERGVRRGYDIIIIARQPSCNAEYKEIESCIQYLANKHKLLLDPGKGTQEAEKE